MSPLQRHCCLLLCNNAVFSSVVPASSPLQRCCLLLCSDVVFSSAAAVPLSLSNRSPQSPWPIPTKPPVIHLSQTLMFLPIYQAVHKHQLIPPLPLTSNFLLYSSAKEIWDAARETFSTSDNTIELFHAESALQDLHQADQSVTAFFSTSTFTRLWQKLDHFEFHEWKCTEDATYFKKIIETKRVFKFLRGLDKSLDDVRDRILSMKPHPNLREVFSEVRHEESRTRIVMGTPTKTLLSESSALATATEEFTSLAARK
ncbi:hypothetical protein ZIOFF_032313 [Zingiber officinale]|uniref:Uncharacterized protein n=1 Tax=Zingiber officinale TaxID=94328 RepID=A0A8J5GV95_ZINOF|nr:hypothetical protein ZIOFF_032313 [Zingiber officinale]